MHPVDLTGMTVEAVKEFGLSRKDAARAKNMFALGLLSWMYGRPTESTIAFLEKRFAKVADIRDANITAFKAGWNFGETTETFVVQYEIKPAPMSAGHLPQHHRQPRAGLRPGRRRRAVRAPGLPGLLPDHPGLRHPPRAAASTRRSASRRSRPRTRSPASAPRSAPSFAGSLGVTTTSGPGIALKSEAIGLAVMTELPLLVIDVQRGGPSTGLPTKTEQADLLQAMFGRNGEAPVPIVAPQSPGDCFDAAIEAARIAVTYRTPVMLLSDGYLANGSEPWRIPDVADLPTIDPNFATERNQTVATKDGTESPRSTGPTCATRTPSPGRGRSPARPGSSTASAASRRPRATATSPTTRPTTTSWCAPARPRSTGSPTRCRRCGSTTRPARPRCW